MTFLTPTLPPAFCGLGDHSRLLAAAMAARGAPASFLALRGDPDEAALAGWPGPARVLDDLGQLPAALDDRAGAAPWLWVQLSAYGYSPRGAPLRLARALTAVRRRTPRQRIAVCVHETHCSPRGLGWRGPLIWALQRRAVAQVVRAADAVFPTHARSWDVCASDYGVAPGRLWLLPIAANVPRVGVSDEARAGWRRARGLPASARVAVVFGQWDSQRHALDRLAPALRGALTRGELDRVVLLGGGVGPWPEWARGDALRRAWDDRLEVLGPVDALAVAHTLGVADVGVVSTPWSCWEKSGAARAYQQAGLELWIHAPGEQGPRVLRSAGPAPSWDDLADVALGALAAVTP